LHELDIQLELFLNRSFNISFIRGKSNKIFCTQAERHESVRKNSFKRSLCSLHINHRYSVSEIIRKLPVAKQDSKPFRMYLHPKKVQYIRYVDHFILAIVGDKKCAFDVIAFIAVILSRLGMTLSPEKSGVKSSIKGVVFLGYHIYSQCSFDAKWKKRKSLKVCDYALHLNIPLQNLFQCFVTWGFFQRVHYKKSFKFVGRRQDKWLFFKNAYEIIYRFNLVIRGVERYYAGVTQKNALVKFWHILKRSAALTLAHKFNKKNVSWAFHKFGKNLTVINPKNGKGIYLYKLRTGVYRFESGELNHLLSIWHSTSIPVTLDRIRSVKELDCAIPNCTLRAGRWYYIKHRKRLKSLKYEKVISSYFAKQIPLCIPHYKLVHVGLYDGPSLRKLSGYIPRNFD
jgi:Type II intron maturase